MLFFHSSSTINQGFDRVLNQAGEKLKNHNLILARNEIRVQQGEIEKLLDLIDSVRVITRFPFFS
jgi:hypothetical protein